MTLNVLVLESERGAADAAVDELYEVHRALGAVTDRAGFGEKMVADRRLVASIHVTRIYGQLLDR